jgi:hypothetical protein
MKIHLQILCAGTLLVFLNGCATTPAGSSTSLAGTWINSLGTVWTIKPDGTFEVDRNHDGKTDITGTYAVTEDTFTILSNQGKIPKRCKGQGAYKFARSGENLSFTLVSDTCGDRKKNMLAPWHKE